MKKLHITSGILLSAVLMASSCKKFDDMLTNPREANVDQVEVEFFLNNAIVDAQMDPHIAERIFVLYWKNAARHQLGSTLTIGADNDDWNRDYFTYISGWLNAANTAIQIADEKKAKGTAWPYNENLKQVARIWRAYLMSEMADNFGPIPVNGFQGTNPEFADVKTVYYHILDELKDAGAKLDGAATEAPEAKYDAAYGWKYAKWKKYAVSMRMRLAMRLSEVDVQKARTEFEAAAKETAITTMDDVFQVQEKADGYNALNGVMSREWNSQIMGATVENIFAGLGGVATTDLLPASFHSYIRTNNDAGLKLTDHFSTKTNEPLAGYFQDGIPATLDPRAMKAFPLAGDFDNLDFCRYGDWSITVRNLVNDNGAVVRSLDGKFTWNGWQSGDWGVYGSRNQLRTYPGANPRLALKFRNSTNKRIFFAPWETYFLLAEAALRGWDVPTTAKAAYETGVKLNFDYWGVSAYATNYLASSDYNRYGTSASFDHVTEPPATHQMIYKDGYTGTPGVVNVLYPVNNIYKNGTIKNDQLTKIITQKYISNLPWLPLESWNDHRRLGLPFFENPSVESPLPNMLQLTGTNYMNNQVNFFAQRLRYPASLKNANAKGYAQAMEALGGDDTNFTPLWWAQK
ncbi:SusD/RagB family nutrient-binding outer membrane lipoprotein [Pseudoflavitalea rhizosphaerae]|uniref:SusD/RagB family nutrient-binding outer membrane lipoprotein n=1 Tax=Pseudoflavitalea rhizosphaerae TaxID=1884793 RepID=UPI000F8D35F2|nr:SusD/RagB family nutrient-binding outer membrane lipoprotein [Pseudoflavitalea rhizosphaerae]